MAHPAIRTAMPLLVLGAALGAAPAGATPPGTNGLIAWQRESPTGFPHVRVANPDGSASRKVFDGRPRRGELEAAFSPADPNVLVFTRFGPGPFSEDIFSGNLATGRASRIGRPRSADIAPAVSPDGTRIAYFGVPRPKDFNPDVPPPERVQLIGVDGSGHRTITPRRRRSIDPDWSPDGRRLVHVEARFRRGRAQNRIVTVGVNGGGRRVLTEFGGVDEVNPKWMPDGQTIVFERLRQRGRRSDIATIPAAGGPVRTILSTRAWETNPVPSPDGTRIVFTSDRHRRSPERLGPGFELYTMAVDGTGIVRLTNNRRPDLFPDWQRLP